MSNICQIHLLVFNFPRPYNYVAIREIANNIKISATASVLACYRYEILVFNIILRFNRVECENAANQNAW